MKHSIKKLVSLVLVAAMLLTVSVPGFAAKKDVKVNKVNDIVTEFKDYTDLYKQKHGDNSDATQILNNFYKENRLSDQPINKPIKKKVIPISKNQEVIFDKDIVCIKTSKIIPKNMNSSALKANLTAANSNWYYTDTYSDSVSVYGNVFGNLLFTVSQSAQFRYNHSTSECIDSDGNYEFTPMNIWQVNNWQDSKITKPRHDGYNWTRVRSQGHFHYGFEIQGAGLVMGNVTAWAYVECNPHGSIKHDANYSNT